MKDFTNTPSYFNNKETFEKYLGQTSYYLTLQQMVGKLIGIICPKQVMELGAATGATTLLLAERFPSIEFIGVDMRDDVVQIAQSDAKDKKVANAVFRTADMCELVKTDISADVVYMLYSYHHILDPLENKIKFLNDTYSNMKKGSYLCIAETFLPEVCSDIKDAQKILELWNVRKDEGGASTFWNALNSLSKESLELAKQIADYSSANEYLAGELVAKRQDEYLIKRSWLAEQGIKSGFELLINQPVNALGDAIVLFYKR